MKGISPMVAVVLLVAFTVAIGGVLSVFFTSLTTTQTQQVSNQSSSIVKCSSVLVIDEVKVPSSAGNFSVNVTFSNVGQQNVTGINIEIFFNNGTVPLTIGGGNILLPGQANVNATAAAISNVVSQVRVRGICGGNQPVSDTCDSSKACWKTG